MLFADVMMSGVTSHCSMPHHFLPVRPQPVCTSSEMIQAAVILHDAVDDLEIFRRRSDESADALNRLGDERGDRAARSGLNHVLNVVRAGHAARSDTSDAAGSDSNTD